MINKKYMGAMTEQTVNQIAIENFDELKDNSRLFLFVNPIMSHFIQGFSKDRIITFDVKENTFESKFLTVGKHLIRYLSFCGVEVEIIFYSEIQKDQYGIEILHNN